MLVIVQARMSSQRFPRKMLGELGGKKLIDHVYLNLEQAKKVSKVIVATSDEETDDALHEYCKKRNMTCYRGKLENVAARFLEVSSQYNADTFIRISGDSPLIDPELVDEMIQQYLDNEADIVTNVQKRTYPKGQSVEVINSKTFRNAYSLFSKPSHFEHVTPFFYENSSSFRIRNIASKEEYGNINLSVDTPEDLLRLNELMAQNLSVSAGWQVMADKYRVLFPDG